MSELVTSCHSACFKWTAMIEDNYPFCTYVDINTIMHKDGVIDENMYEPDGLYLSAHGYRAWVDELKTQFLNKLIIPKRRLFKTQEIQTNI